MSKVIDFIAKVLDDGETSNEKDIQIPSFRIERISMRLFITTSWFVPLAGTIVAGTFMDVDSRDFKIAILPLLINTLIILILILCEMIKEVPLSKKQMALIIGLTILAVFLRMILFPTN